ncbi:MAG: septum formation initiator family protein [Desulfovermiculus sp.]|nr:septum formation initiator family protein [Desulfovermiculus sp.]
MLFRVILITLLAVNILLIWAIFQGEQGLGIYRQQQARLEKMQARLNQVRKDNIELSRKIRLLQNDDVYVEQMIRTRLHYVQSHEVMYLPRKTQIKTSSAQ